MALSAVAAITIPTARTIPWMEFAADISGVCKVAGTLLMTSNPTQRLNTKTIKSKRSIEAVPPGQSPLAAGGVGLWAGSGSGAEATEGSGGSGGAEGAEEAGAAGPASALVSAG